MRVISFKLWGDFAHFRRHYTTSSPLTHSIPPPSALRGIIAAILGLGREEYPQILSPENAKIGVRLLNPVKKIRLGVNYMDTKDGSWVQIDFKKFRPVVKSDGHGNPRLHTQIRMEFIKDPAYEIFFHHKDDALSDDLSSRLKGHRSVYTPYLGISECIANFEFEWDEDVKPAKGFSHLVSAVLVSDLKEFKLQDDTGIVKERIPLFINSERVRIESGEILFNPYAKTILANVDGAMIYPGTEDSAFSFIG